MQETIYARMYDALLPAPHRRFGQAQAAHDGHDPASISGGRDDLGPRGMLLRRVAIARDRLQAAAVFRRDGDLDPHSHPTSMDRISSHGNPPNASVH